MFENLLFQELPSLKREDKIDVSTYSDSCKFLWSWLWSFETYAKLNQSFLVLHDFRFAPCVCFLGERNQNASSPLATWILHLPFLILLINSQLQVFSYNSVGGRIFTTTKQKPHMIFRWKKQSTLIKVPATVYAPRGGGGVTTNKIFFFLYFFVGTI